MREKSASASVTAPWPTPRTTAPPRLVAGRDEGVSASTEDFMLGVDTCGFTSGSTYFYRVTCTAGYCTNVGDHRGCCTGSPADCSASIWTECYGYGEGNGAGFCGGAHTLCCDADLPACITHFFTTAASPGFTFTNVGCGATPALGEMYPFPPELLTMTADSEFPTDAAASPTDDAAMGPGSSSSSSSSSGARSSPTGAIVGAAVGGFVALCLAALAVCVVWRRRRRGGGRGPQAPRPVISRPSRLVGTTIATGPGDSKLGDGGGGGGPITPQSPLAPRPPPPPPPPRPPPPAAAAVAAVPAAAATGLSRYRSARRSYGPDWPLGAADPLEAHPPDVGEKRRSRPRGGAVPLLQVPARPATRLAPAPAPKSPRSPMSPMSPSSSSSSPSSSPLAPKSPRSPRTPVSASSAAAAAAVAPEGYLPRLSFLTTPTPIHAGLGGAVFARGASEPDADAAATGGGGPESPRAPRRNPPPAGPEAVVVVSSPAGEGAAALDHQRASLASVLSNGRRAADEELVSPVSPEDDDGDDDDDDGAAASAPEEDDDFNGDGRSAGTVSPLESRRGSLDGGK